MYRLLLLFVLTTTTLVATEDSCALISFDPPKDWRYADLSQYPKSVKMVVVGKGKHTFPPQLNLNAEHFKGSLSEYLQIVKKYNEFQKTPWTDLGPIQTKAGQAHLSQVDVMTEWGIVRMMHVILRKDEVVYILNASALKEEFSNFYPDFFAAMRSLSYNNSSSDQAQGLTKRAATVSSAK